MDAIGLALAGIGVYLGYTAYKGEHPWTVFKGVLGTSSATPSTKTAPNIPSTNVNHATLTGRIRTG